MSLSYYEYKKEVVEKAYAKHTQPICTDTVRDSYYSNKSVEQAVEVALSDTLYWETGM